ncbi:transglycosylase SLT domain-containing protein [uncultured Tateyamaria sp.]|uniref:transglycosylase SLT domain-containing protein n=1 Tax=uncultured Tateyamaria sp. TaxID=455651 RepID=UPI00261DE0B3|nr:transglycosylase SLT domain-containing protein [uncultured Tateyamaria sp.]
MRADCCRSTGDKSLFLETPGGQVGARINILSVMFRLCYSLCLFLAMAVPVPSAAQGIVPVGDAAVDQLASDVREGDEYGQSGLDGSDDGRLAKDTSNALRATDPSNGLRPGDPFNGLRPIDPFNGLRPPARTSDVPSTRWTHQPDHMLWNRSTLSALKAHGAPLVDLVPADVTDWCPRYPSANDADRRAFWLGFLSALAKHESTYKPRAVGGGGKWYGLLQILPATARGYGCNVGTGAALKNGAANLSCAVRIMAVTVPRDGVIYGRGGKGVAADWGPLRSKSKRADMAGWLRRQRYCAPLDSVRPVSRPAVPTIID